MNEILGYVVCAETLQYAGLGYPQVWYGTGSRFRWPICAVEGDSQLAADLRKWQIDGLFPELYDPQMLAHDMDYVRLYHTYCSENGIQTRIYAFSMNEKAFMSTTYGVQSVFLGFDCVAEGSFESYLFWDSPSVTELKMHGFQLNSYLHFATKEEAERYGRVRRTYLSNGASIEDMGNEIAVAVAQIVFNANTCSSQHQSS